MNEGVDGIGRPRGVGDIGDGGHFGGAESPVLGFIGDGRGNNGFGFRLGCVYRGAGPGRASVYPKLQNGNGLLGKLSLGRHLKVVVFIANRLDEATACRVPGDNRRLDEELGQGVEAEPGLLFFRAVAADAVFLEHRQDVIAKKGIGVR